MSKQRTRARAARAFLALVLGALAPGPSACAPAHGPRAVVELAPDATWSGPIDFADAGRLDFALDVPADAVLVRVRLECPQALLDLYAQPDGPIDDLEQATWAFTEEDGPREAVLDCLSEDPVAGTRWYFAALWPFATPPRSGGKVIERAEVTMHVQTFLARIDAELAPKAPLHSQLDLATGGFRTFRVHVPEGARALRLDLFDVSSNLDLYARHGGPILRDDATVAFAENAWGHETLVIEPDSEPPLEPGDWYVDVLDAVGPTRTLPFSIVAGLDPEVPAQLRALPALPAVPPEGTLERALLAVVELATRDGVGSGTILTPDGWILTNEHVVGDDPDVEIVVSLSLDPTLPPEESFRARLVRSDPELDLALVRIESGLYGQPLPHDYALPTLELGDPGAMRIGDALLIVGYPTTGGTGSRVTISATRGILSGFERVDSGVLFKTDAEITNGNSGGAALDVSGHLVAVPTATVENRSGQIGYLEPVSAVPAAWLRMLAR